VLGLVVCRVVAAVAHVTDWMLGPMRLLGVMPRQGHRVRAQTPVALWLPLALKVAEKCLNHHKRCCGEVGGFLVVVALISRYYH